MKFSKKILINSVLVSILALCGNFYINAKPCLHVTASKNIFDTKSIFSNAEWNIIHHELISKLSANNFDKFCKAELNELNFYRIYFNIDLLSSEAAAITTKYKINKIRIHYWPNSSGVESDPHNHGNSFESYIIHGGYENLTFDVFDDVSAAKEYDRASLIPVRALTINKRNSTPIDLGQKYLLKTQERDEQEGDVVNYSDSTAIHQVQNIKTQTVSINIILEDGSRDCRELYLLNNAKCREPERFSLSPDEREQLVNTVLDKLINHVNRLKYKV